MNIKPLLFLALTVFSNWAYAVGETNWELKTSTENGLFVVLLQPESDIPIIGDYHNWIIEVTDENENGIENAQFSFGGGMAAHGHGLPSKPVVTSYLGEGKYLIEGMLFNMSGEWTLAVAIRKDNFIDKTQFTINLDF